MVLVIFFLFSLKFISSLLVQRKQAGITPRYSYRASLPNLQRIQQSQPYGESLPTVAPCSGHLVESELITTYRDHQEQNMQHVVFFQNILFSMSSAESDAFILIAVAKKTHRNLKNHGSPIHHPLRQQQWRQPVSPTGPLAQTACCCEPQSLPLLAPCALTQVSLYCSPLLLLRKM
jgi:hypothetical protein